MRIILMLFFLVASPLGMSYRNYKGFMRMRNRAVAATHMGPLSALSQNQIDQYTHVPTTYIRPSITDKARTITHVCSSGTLCTSSVMKDVEGFPFGSYVDFIADENGHPVMLISNQSLHTQNLRHNPSVSLFCQLPRQVNNQASASLSRVTIMGKVEHVPPEELPALQTAFTLIHPYSEQIIESPKFKLLRIKPEKIYFSGGFGVLATWVNVQEYEQAKADVLATEVPSVLARVNMDKQGELLLLCKHFLGITDVEVVRVQAIDRLGIDLRIKTGEFTDEYRVGFRHEVNSSEDAKSEMVKLFQEAWEREQGYFFTDELPPITKYAEDILRAGGGAGDASAGGGNGSPMRRNGMAAAGSMM